MASNFFQCICGGLARIDMMGWVHGDRVIRCQCGRNLKADSTVLGFGLETANCAWAKYMRKDKMDEYINNIPKAHPKIKGQTKKTKTKTARKKKKSGGCFKK